VSDDTPSCCQPVEEKPPPKPRKPPTTWSDYRPLIVLVTFTLLAALSKQLHYGAGWDGVAWMHDFMGFFLVVFSMFKVCDVSGFADGFQKYDLLASRCRPYALAYPFLELVLGLGYLGHWQPTFIYLATIVLLGFGALGVLRALKRGLDLQCACMGTALKVPLTTVALTEDLVMVGMAVAMLSVS
jgi:hypothetical protein